MLIVATGLVWAFGAAWITLSTNAKLERVLDARLREAANMVSSLIESHEIGLTAAAGTLDAGEWTHEGYQRQLSCQIWSLSGDLVGKSAGAPDARLSNHAAGYAVRVVDGERWRVYAVRNERAGVEVLVGDNLTFRNDIVREMLLALTVPMLVTLPLLAAILWFAVGRGLAPLSRLAARLERRRAEDLQPLPEDDATQEIRPVVRALNGLFHRVAELLGREREFLAVAAHELKTPLSGLRTQAEIAARAPDEATRTAALGRIITGVDRNARLVRQLLAFGEAEAAAPATGDRLRLLPVVSAASAEAAARLEATGGRLVVDDGLADVVLAVGEAPLALAVRNLAENGATYATGGTVWIGWGDGALVVEDDGGGMAPEEFQRASGRFYRGSNRKGIGSGLGLSIVEACAARMEARLDLGARAGGGFRAALRFPAARIVRASVEKSAGVRATHPGPTGEADSGTPAV
nr:ATP-binding protein [Acuticoccus mangrovi]